MSYWKGLLFAVAIDLGWIMGCPASATGPEVAAFAPVIDVRTLDALGEVEDSLMLHLQQDSTDVDAIAKLADIYARNGWYDSAIGPLARALQLDPSRRSLWSALDNALEKLGREKITDAELVQRAASFRQAVEMWGHGC